MYDTSNYPDPHNNDAENNLFGLDGLDASTIYLIMGICPSFRFIQSV